MVNLHDDVNGVLKPSQYWGRPNSMSATAAAIAGALVLLSAAVLHSVGGVYTAGVSNLSAS